jgi:hypothetical protein
MKKLDSSTQTIGEIFRKPFLYKVPANQRDFAWTDEEVDLLWGDLMSAMDEDHVEYFLGAIVVARNTENQKEYEIVDGQQRLTCLSMIYSALRSAWAKLGDPRADDVFRDFLGAKDRRDPETVRPKLTLNATNDPIYRRVVLESKVLTDVERKGWVKSNKLLFGAFARLKMHLDQRLAKSKNHEEVLIEIEEFISSSANVIWIEVGDETDAYILFETLNDRGLNLAVSDLVKNYLFSKADNSSGLDSFKKSWSEISMLVGAENLPSFLRHYWLSEYELIRERDLYRRLREKIVGKSTVRRFVEALRGAADHYAALTNPEHSFWSELPVEARKHLEALLLFKVSQFRPFALAVMKHGKPDEIRSMLRLLEANTFRYSMIGGRSANALERMYSDAALDIRKNGKTNVQTMRHLLKEAVVDDKSFMNDFATRAIQKAQIARYALSAINRHLTPDKATKIDETAVSLEHILPETQNNEWSGAIPKDDLWDTYVNLVGNLTLLEKAQNRGLGGKGFDIKRSKGYAVSTLAINKDLAESRKWSAASIQERSVRLAKIAKDIWKVDT